jgi:hypothetical protein
MAFSLFRLGSLELKARIGEAYASGAVPDGYRMFGPEVLDFIKKAHAAAKKK